MKIIHFSDVHLGMENYGKVDQKTGLSTRLGDFLKSFDYLVDYCLNKKNRVDLVLFTGDAYKTRDPSPTYLQAFSQRIKRLADAMPVVLIVGNHDLPNTTGKANTLDIFSALNVPGVYVSKKPELLKISAGDDVLQIATLPWMNKVDLLGNRPEHTIEETNRSITQKLGQIIRKFNGSVDRQKPAILAAHYSVSGASYGSEQGVMIGRDMSIDIRDLKNSKFNYIALGHLHKHQILLHKPLTIYPGSIERIDFGEEKDEKGFAEINFKKVKSKSKFLVNFRFIPTPARKFISLDINIGLNDDPTKAVLKNIEPSKIKNAIVKINIRLTQDQSTEIQYSKIQERLVSAFYIAAITTEITDMLKTKNVAIFQKDLAWQDILDDYLKDKNVPPKRAKRIKEAAETLMIEAEKEI